MTYVERTAINVSKHIEKKGRFSYLSWVFALDELQKQDETATWAYQDHIIYPDGSMMVTTTVTAFDKTLQMLLPVMDHNNKAIKNPDAFAINKAYMRCLAKNVAAHGIGLYIFAGEDLPNAEDTPTQGKPQQKPAQAKPKAPQLKIDELVAMVNKTFGTRGADCLKELTTFGDPGAEKFMELDKLSTYSEKWIDGAIKKVKDSEPF